MSEDKLSFCGWCLTDRCDQCLPSGDDWVCECTHDKLNMRDSYHRRLVTGVHDSYRKKKKQND